MSLTVEIFSLLEDNYGTLIHDTKTGATATMDAADEVSISAALERTGWTLTDIFITHHHWDHTDAVLGLKERYNCRVTGPRFESDKIAGLDVLVGGGDKVTLGSTELVVFATPGHTEGHVVYYDAAGGHLFTGDALFSLGCGRMFEGTPGPMWAGLLALRDLPDTTKIYCGHEYSAANATFARHIDPDNEMLKTRQKEIKSQLAAGKYTIPVSLGLEKATNPFLRADDLAIAKALGMESADPTKIFAALRKAKDVF